MNEKPSVLVVSSSKTRPKSIIQLLIKSKINSNSLDFILQPFTIDTKYYKSDINIIGFEQNEESIQELKDSVEAIIIHFDSNKSSGIEELTFWNQLVDECQPEIKLLLANYCTEETKITKTVASEWCFKYGFELIELYPSIGDVEDEIIEEKIGVARVIEALEAHAWPNLIIKRKKDQTDHNNEDVDDDFSDLFAQFGMMKDSLQSLPVNQRKQAAEQVVTAFWRAIGGDEDEISD